ncbi:MAG: hypothetical protein KKF30_10430 [Proteobacteria bacterium]|nr:hypothetical protein [Pseudomonadota bacterium]MBU4470309.1 hypothetical protein [Pseudomonadota bacterium]MCG2752721.1 hypothetical protein [Desulfobacteraceae bacterium]
MDGLTAINFQNMQLAGDISVLSELTKLQNVSFYLTGDDITGDMSSLAGLTELSAISFNECTAGLTYTSSSLLWKVNDAERECDFIFVGTRFSQTEVDNLLANLDSLSISIPSLFRRILLTGLNSAPSSASISVIASLEAKGWTVYIYPAAEEILEESFSLDDLSVWATGYSKIINEALRLFDSNGVGFHVQVAESLGVAEQLKEILGILAHDFLNLNPGLFSNWKGSEQASSGISLAETSSFGKLFADTIAEGVGLSDFSSFSFHLLILDSLVCSSSVEAAGLFQRQIMEAMTLTDSALKAWESLIEDVFSIVESASLIYGVMATVEESVSLSGNSAYLLFANEAVNDSFQLQPSIALRSVLGAVVQDSLGIFCQVLIDGEVWECWVLNTNKFHPSIYSGFDFNSYAIFEGMAYGAKVDGIYELTGDLDNGSGIRSGVAFPETDFGTVSEKRFRKAYLGIAGDSPVLKVENENDYGFYGIENDKTTINRSLHGERWAFSILDFDELEFVELVPVILSRRQA